ncbi:HigA family addiction module antitoxin [Desulfosarcina ovata]|nr:HigA family addiction module antitoxin [Desulfosarcina ovata]
MRDYRTTQKLAGFPLIGYFTRQYPRCSGPPGVNTHLSVRKRRVYEHCLKGQLADSMHVPYQRVNEIINGRRGVTPSTALRLSKFFGVSPDFWMNIQLRWDLYFAQQAEAAELNSINPVENRVATVY